MRASHLVLGLLIVFRGGPASAVDVKEQYEEKLVRWALDKNGLVPDPAPEGKRLERIVIEREDIIARSDPWPGFLNILHVTTRDSVIRQELLIREGQTWNADLVKESERNLRKLFILSIARIVPCRSSKPGQIVLLVVTKDLWSIRLNSLFSMVGSTLQFLDFFPTEQNFLGRNKRVSLHVQLRQLELSTFALADSFSLGNIYVDERLLGSRVRLSQRFDAIIAGDVPCGGSLGGQPDIFCPGRSFGELEGIYGYLWLERPLFSLSTRWGFSAFGLVDTGQQRSYVQPGPRLRTVSLARAAGLDERDGEVVRVYDRSRTEVYAAGTRSLGRTIKHNVTVGLDAYRNRYALPEGFVWGPSVARWFADRYLPRSESAAFLFSSYRTFRPTYLKLRDIDTLGLTEDFALGHDATLQVRGAVELGSFEPEYLEALVDVLYRWHFDGDLLTLRLAMRSRWQPGITDDPRFADPFTNAVLEAVVHNISAPVLFGRVHLRVRLLLRHQDLKNETEYLGGDNGLRGYASRQFEGDNALQANIEYRSRPLNILTAHVGLVLFYDAGGVWGGPDPSRSDRELAFAFHQSVGLGLRALFPQFDKEPLRIDFGVPLSEERGGIGTWFSLSFKQAF